MNQLDALQGVKEKRQIVGRFEANNVKTKATGQLTLAGGKDFFKGSLSVKIIPVLSL